MPESTVQDLILAHRTQLNVLFEQARMDAPALSGERVFQVLKDVLFPVLRPYQTHPEAGDVLISTYASVLKLIRRGIWDRHPFLAELWMSVLPQLTVFFPASPDSTIRIITHSVLHVSRKGGRISDFVSGLATLAPEIHSIEALKRWCVVLAWRSGLVQFRAEALLLCEVLDADQVGCLFGTPPETVPDWLKQCAASVWFRPDRLLQKRQAVGGFDGLIGENVRNVFKKIPQIAAHQNQLWVTDGTTTWRLLADGFGVQLEATDEDFPKTKLEKRKHPDFPHATAVIQAGETLGITLPDSYQIFLVPA